MPADSRTARDWLETIRLVRWSLLAASVALLASLLAYVTLSKFSPAILLIGLVPIGLWLYSSRWQFSIPSRWEALGQVDRRPLLRLLEVNAAIAALLLCGVIATFLASPAIR